MLLKGAVISLKHVNIRLDGKEIRGSISWRDFRQDHTEIFATVNLLLGENLGEIRGRIPARFWPLGLLLPSENLGEIRGRIAPRFWPLGFLLLGENLGKFRGRISVRF